MDDLINRNVAIDALRAIKHGLWEIDIPSPTVPEYVEHHEQIKNMMEIVDGWIKRIKAEPAANRWIPWNSGRFPEESGTYTVTAYDGATKRVTYAKYQKRLKRWELTGARAYWRVVAWMPLPESYGGDKDAE